MNADLVEAAAALRWARPDLTAELADHVLEEASAAGQRDRWLAAAGWAVHARAATGDGRETACGVLAALGRWGADALTGAAAHRLRIELAMVAAGAGEVESARRLLAAVRTDGDPELTADLLCAHARCAVEDSPDEVVAALDAADAAWATVGGPAAQLGGASVALVRAVVERRAGRPAAAVDHAADGLARLERVRAGSGAPSGHLAAALAAEWISALLDAGRVAEARDGCGALLPRLSERARPTRQLALLRLTVTRTLAAQDARADTAQLLAQAADDAAGSDVPDLEAVCRTALGALHEQAGRLDVALAALQLAVEAERRDRARARRFLAALAELPTAPSTAPSPVPPVEPEQPKRHRERPGAPAVPRDDAMTSAESTMLLPAITRGDRKLKANRGEDEERGPSRFERLLEDSAQQAAAEERSSAWDAVPWSSSLGESPIGDLLIRSFRPGAAEPSQNGSSENGAANRTDENGSARRNGKSVGGAGRRSEERGTSSGWVPTLDREPAGEEEPPARRRDRSVDPDRRRSRRAREDREVAAPAPARHSESTVRYPGEDPTAPEPPARPRRRARHGEEADGADGRTARGRHGRSADLDAPGGDSGLSRGMRSGGGTRRRSQEPSTTDADRRDEPEPVPAAPVEVSGESDGWLQSALAELDRALSGIGVGRPVELSSPEPPDDGCAVVVDIARDGRRFAGPRAAAVVRSVADLLGDRLPVGARSRFGESDALVVTRAGWSRAEATDWMHRTLPGLLDGFVAAEELPGAQLRVAVHDAGGPVGAQILQPLASAGRERGAAEDRRGADAGDDPWAELTASTSEARGQKYRAAARAGRPERGSRGAPESDPDPAEALTSAAESPRWPFSEEGGGPDDPAPPDEDTGRHGADRARSARDGSGETGRRRRQSTEDRASGEQAPAEPTGSGRAARRRGGDVPSSSRANGTGSQRSESQRNGSNGTGSNGNGSHGNGVASGAGTGRRAKRDADTATLATERAPERTAEKTAAPEAPAREPERVESTEGLGIADLLAGALAAYRGI